MRKVPIGSIQLFANTLTHSYLSENERDKYSSMVVAAYKAAIESDLCLHDNIEVASWNSKPGCIIITIYIVAFVGAGAVSRAAFLGNYSAIKAGAISAGNNLAHFLPDSTGNNSIVGKPVLYRYDLEEKEALLKALKELESKSPLPKTGFQVDDDAVARKG